MLMSQHAKDKGNPSAVKRLWHAATNRASFKASPVHVPTVFSCLDSDLSASCCAPAYPDESRACHQRLRAAYGHGGTGTALRRNWAASLVWKVNHVLTR